MKAIFVLLSVITLGVTNAFCQASSNAVQALSVVLAHFPEVDIPEGTDKMDFLMTKEEMKDLELHYQSYINNNCRQLSLKYKEMTKLITVPTALKWDAMIRAKLTEDIAYWKQKSEHDANVPMPINTLKGHAFRAAKADTLKTQKAG